MNLRIDILFEPTLVIGQRIDLVSVTESGYNGQYKIIGIQHSGTISGAVGGKCKTSLLLNAGEYKLNPIMGELVRTPVSLGLS